MRWQGRDGKVIIRAPSEIPHETIATAVTNSPDTEPALVDAILNKNYEFQTTAHTVTVERKDLESMIKGLYGLQEHPDLEALIEDNECETLLTEPELRPRPSRTLPPVAITIDEDDSSVHPTNPTTITDTHAGDSCRAERSQDQKVVDQDENTIEEAQRVVNSAPVAPALSHLRQGPHPEHVSMLDTPMIGIISGECGMSSGSPHSLMGL